MQGKNGNFSEKYLNAFMYCRFDMEEGKIKARKIEDVEFEIGQRFDGLHWIIRNGSLYISLSQLILTDGNGWYEMPINTLENISVISTEPPKIQIRLQDVVVALTGTNADRLLALRHLLLPYLKKERDNEMRSLLKLWHLGIRNIKALDMLLHIGENEVKDLVLQAKNKHLIDENNQITKKGYSMFSDEERELLREIFE